MRPALRYAVGLWVIFAAGLVLPWRGSLAVLLICMLLCSCAPNFDGFHFDDASSSNSTDAGELERDAQAGASRSDASSSNSTDAGELDAGAQADASSSDASSSNSTDAGELDAGAGGSDASTDDAAVPPADAGHDAGPCLVTDPTCHGCVAPAHWCAFQRICGLPTQC